MGDSLKLEVLNRMEDGFERKNIVSNHEVLMCVFKNYKTANSHIHTML